MMPACDKSASFFYVTNISFPVGADPCVCPKIVHFMLSGGHTGPPLRVDNNITGNINGDV